jgi:hypothetical protein
MPALPCLRLFSPCHAMHAAMPFAITLPMPCHAITLMSAIAYSLLLPLFFIIFITLFHYCH